MPPAENTTENTAQNATENATGNATGSTVANRVCLVTGASSGFGQHLTHQLLNKGALVAGTFRQADQAEAFTALAPGRSLGVVMDVTDGAAVARGVQQVASQLGPVDALLNNAGYGVAGAIEETSAEQARGLFDVHLFGGLSLIQQVLPSMRERGAGRILQFSGIGGFVGFPGLGVYSAAKAAADVLGEALAAEVAPLGVKVTVLTIGAFHTEFAGKGLRHAEPEIDAYAKTPAGRFRKFIARVQGKQPNHVAKGAAAIINLLEADNPPVHAALGADALKGMRTKMKHVQEQLAAWEDNANSTAKDD
ncbi:MAG: SDR family NAD(P)-dependent oxidoreductase [Planctomycetota bacterium]